MLVRAFESREQNYYHSYYRGSLGLTLHLRRVARSMTVAFGLLFCLSKLAIKLKNFTTLTSVTVLQSSTKLPTCLGHYPSELEKLMETEVRCALETAAKREERFRLSYHAVHNGHIAHLHITYTPASSWHPRTSCLC